MSSVLRSVSFHSAAGSRNKKESARPLLSIDEHVFPYDKNTLLWVFGSMPSLAEVGGVPGLAHALRSHVQTGLYADEVYSYKNEPDFDSSAPVLDSSALQPGQFKKRLSRFGENVYPANPKKSFLEFCLETLSDPLLILLLVAGIVSVGLGLADDLETGWYEGLSILMAVVLVTLVSSYNNYQQQEQFAALDATVRKEAASNICTVIRGGETVQIRPEAVQVGELVILSPGNFIPADGILATADAASSVLVNESRMTGESVEVEKDFYHPFLFGGTEVRQGECTMLVTAVGEASAYGQIMKSLIKEPEETPLQKKLERVATLIGKIGAFAAAVLFVALFIRWLVDIAGKDFTAEDGTHLLEIVIVCVTLIVVAIPEGLPLAVTVSLAYSMKKMYKDQIVVHELSACETMGNATKICSDKTGTLTQNKMKVVQCWLGSNLYTKAIPTPTEMSEYVRHYLIHSIVINSKSWIDTEVGGTQEDLEKAGQQPEDWAWREGNQTEIALLSFCTKYNVNVTKERSKYPVERSFPFDSTNKQSSILISDVVLNANSVGGKNAAGLDAVLDTESIEEADEDVEQGEQDEKEEVLKPKPNGTSSNASMEPASPVSPLSRPAKSYRRYFKGAAERILASCTRYVDNKGQVHTFKDESEKEEVKQFFTGLAAQGLRTIGCSFVDFATHEIPRDEEGNLKDPPKREDCVLIAILGIQDPLRPESAQAVKDCQRAGISVTMVTGDALETAKSIATQCGIFDPDHPDQHIAMLGEDLRQLFADQREADLQTIIPRLRVVARSAPTDKELLVRWLKEHGEIVAVTGDGSNDAPALNAAHVGIAMFIAGTAVAKAAAKIWVLDDNFASIVKSVVWGRAVYDNIRKFVQFQLSVNVTALLLTVIGAISGKGTPLTAVQLLWVNLIMDTFAALALGTENPEPEQLLSRNPYPQSASIVSRLMWKNILAQSAAQLLALLLILYAPLIFTYNSHIVNMDPDVQYTIIFNAFVWLQLFNEFNCRRINGEWNIFEHIFSNHIYIAIWIATAGVQALIVEFSYSFANVTSLTWQQWLISIAIGAVSLPVGTLARALPTPEGEYNFGRFIPRTVQKWFLSDENDEDSEHEKGAIASHSRHGVSGASDSDEKENTHANIESIPLKSIQSKSKSNLKYSKEDSKTNVSHPPNDSPGRDAKNKQVQPNSSRSRDLELTTTVINVQEASNNGQ